MQPLEIQLNNFGYLDSSHTFSGQHMKKFLLPSKREGIAGAEASNSEPPVGGVDNRRNKRAADTDIAPVVIKIESDVSSDSAFEGSPARLIERKSKQVTKTKQKFRVKTDESSGNVLSEASSATSFPAFPSDIEDAQSSLLTWCAVPLACCCQMSRNVAGTLQTSATFLGGVKLGIMRRMVCGCLKSCCSRRGWLR